MALRFTTTDKASADHGIKALVYGAAGTGKTHLCGTAPRPLIISAESGLMTLRGSQHKVALVDSYAEVQEVLQWCRTYAAKEGILTICLDSISEIVEKCLATARAKSKDPRQAYGEMATLAIELIKDFRDLAGFHVLFTAKEQRTTDELTGAVTCHPQAPGKQVGPQMPYLFDLVLHSYSDRNPTDGSTFFALRTQRSFGVDAKDRSNSLDEVEYPDFNNIVNKIRSAQPTT